MPLNKNLLLAILVFAQFAGTSLWFAGNVLVKEMAAGENETNLVSFLSSMVQAGFISGTLIFALLTLPDRFRASVLFFICSTLAAFTNISILFFPFETPGLAIQRFCIGFFLAGIYPVGMKIAAEKFAGKLGNALGFLVGALVLGTAIPHLVDEFGNWKMVVVITSLLALTGGILVLTFLPSKKSLQKNSFQPATAFHLFRDKNFRSAAFGYFGHMWELYAFWALLPLIILHFHKANDLVANSSLLSFAVIAAGSVGCFMGGIISRKKGSRNIALTALLVSGLCCFMIPFTVQLPLLFYFIIMIWGVSVPADSPQFSTMVAHSAPSELKGTALAIVTSIGFAITILSIHLLGLFIDESLFFVWILLPGPVIGIFSALKYREK